MSVHGVPQLKKLTIHYCDYSGSSKGVRDFIRNRLISFSQQYPHINFHAALSRRSQPIVAGLFINDSIEQLSLENLSVSKIENQLIKLISKAPHPPLKRWYKAHTNNRSIQGYWSPLLNYIPPKEKINKDGEYASRLIEKQPDLNELNQKLESLGLSHQSMRRFFMSDEQKRQLKTNNIIYRDFDEIKEYKDKYNIDIISPFDPDTQSKEFEQWNNQLEKKLKDIKLKKKQDTKLEKQEKQQIKYQLRRERIHQMWRDNLIIKAKYQYNHIRPDILYAEFPVKNNNGNIITKPLESGTRSNPKYEELINNINNNNNNNNDNFTITYHNNNSSSSSSSSPSSSSSSSPSSPKSSNQ